MTLYLHRAERADTLAAALAELLAEPLADVFADEVVAVPARGIERWLTQQLSHRLGRRAGAADGVCAGVRFLSPSALVNVVVTDQPRPGPARPVDPWAPEALVWPLLEVIDECSAQPWCSTLGRHLGAGAATAQEQLFRRGRRYAVARRLAGLFDSYALNRSPMLTDWAAGRDTDGLDGLLPEHLAWQAELWRRVRSLIGAPDPMQRRASALGALRSNPAGSELPQRLSLFGPTRLPQAHLEVIEVLAASRDVHLWLPHPSPGLWNRLSRGSPAAGDRHRPGNSASRTRRQDETVTSASNPLLASLGRDSRELQLVLAGVAVPTVDLHHPTDNPGESLLNLLQRNLRDDEAPRRTDERERIGKGDRSVQVHACHGPARQVDVLREVLVSLLAADPTLEPRDVLVMCPDIEVYAPLIAAAFGLADVVGEVKAHPGHRLRVRLADRALTQTNPLLSTVARLLDLADGRVTASEVLDLASRPPVRRRFGFDDDDLDRLARWVGDAGVRWGIDAAHRGPFGLQGFQQNTWRSGLDRILVGVAMADEDQNRLGLALPLDDVGSGDIDLAGRLAELLERLQKALDGLSGTMPLQHWMSTLMESVDNLSSVSGDDGWQSAEVRRELGDVIDAAGGRAEVTALTLTDVRALLAGRLGGRPTRANFRTGTLTVCTMVPMRSVPHRVVCLLGLDDGSFPRHRSPDGDDILSRDPMIGERDARGEDRQLMLDAILAAEEHLVITYTGADERTGAIRPPAVPLGELLDALDEAAETADGQPVVQQVLVRHPLQPFDARNVIPGALGVPGPFSFDAVALEGARAAAGARHADPPFLLSPLSPPSSPAGDVDLADLIQLLLHPARGFLRQRLDVATLFDEDDPSDSLTVELDSLQRWAVGDRLLADRLAGVEEEACRQAEWRRGLLPPGPLGRSTLDEVVGEVRPLVDLTAKMLAPQRRTVDVVVPLAAGRELRGTVAGVHGTALVTVTYSRLGFKHQLSIWTALLALAAAHPERPWTAVAVGRGEPGRPQAAGFGPIEPAKARTYLTQLVGLFDAGLCEPLPLPLKTSAEYASAIIRTEGADRAAFMARRMWVSGKYPGEDADAAHTAVWGAHLPFERLLSLPGSPGEDRTGEQSRLAELSVRLWGPLLQHRRWLTL